MEQVEEINNKLNKIIELLTNIIGNNIKAEATEEQQPQPKDSQELNIKDALIKNNLPVDKEYIEDLETIVNKLGLNQNDIEEIFKRLDKYQKENTIKDIYKLSFKFMYNYKEELTKGNYSTSKPYKRQYKKRKGY